MSKITREEAIQCIKHELLINVNRKDLTGQAIGEALDMAIEALTYQNLSKPNNTCEVGLISRADAIDAIQNAYCKPCKERGDDHNEVRCRVCEYDNAIIQIDALPSADAVQGEWVDWLGNGNEWECSVCKCSIESHGSIAYNYCPMCGAKMVKGGDDE